MDKTELSYQAHKNNLNSRRDEVEGRLFGMMNNDSIAYQLLKKTIDVIQPFVKNKNSWLTVGDYNGFEANYLIKNGQDAIASDITDMFLVEAAKEGLIKEYRAINVEKIDYPDQSFDYVFCKEAYHHFPRAYVGLHEMIRCSGKAAMIIEPIDIITKMPLLLFMKNVLDRINPMAINKIWRNRFSFEPVGNYVYKISEREIEKIAMGMGLPCIAFKKLNMILNPQVDMSLIRKTPIYKPGWKKLMRQLKFKNLLGFLRIIPYNHLCCVLFKTEPDAETRQEMKKSGYTILDLPSSPYLEKMAKGKE